MAAGAGSRLPPGRRGGSRTWGARAEAQRSAGAEMLYARLAMVAIVNAVKDIDRLRQISTVLVKHGFGEIVARIGIGGGGAGTDAPTVTRAERLRLVIEELGPSFIKLGQIV